MFRNLKKQSIGLVHKKGRKHRKLNLEGIMGKNKKGECEFLNPLAKKVMIKRNGYEGFECTLDDTNKQLRIFYGSSYNKASPPVRINIDGTLTLHTIIASKIPILGSYQIEHTSCQSELIIHYKI